MFAPSYATTFMADLEGRILEDIELQPRIQLRYIDNSSFIWEHEKDSLKRFIEALNACQPTIKFRAEWLKEKVNLLYVNVKQGT